jgi:RNA polymerase sigma factor (sigma-70 family)
VQDREIVAAIVAGQPGGLAAGYDRYAQALHAYCCSMLGEPSDAADAVQDTFIIAAAKLGGLRDPDRLRPWLYAVARNECHRRLRGRAAAAPLDEAGEMPDDAPEVGVSAEQAELRGLVRAALGGLNPGEREIIELNLRHELDGAGLAAALGVPRNQAHALASRARTQFETSLGALLVARTGQEACPELAGLLAGWGGELTVLLRKRINRHIENCDICGERKRRELSPAALLSLLPVALLPAGLRRELFRLVADRSTVAAEHRDLVVQRAGPMGPDGFPVPVSPPAAPRRVFSRTAVLTGAAVAVLVLGGAAVFAADLLHHGGSASAALSTPGGGGTPSGAAAATGTATPDRGRHDRSAPHTAASTPAPVPGSAQPSATQPAAARSAPAGTRTPTTTRTPTLTPSPAPSASRSRSASPSPSPAPTPGTLTASATEVRLTQSAEGGPYTGSFTLTAAGGPVTFSITSPVPASELSISPASGSLAAGQAVTVTLSAPAQGGPPTDLTPLTVDPGGLTVEVFYPPSS